MTFPVSELQTLVAKELVASACPAPATVPTRRQKGDLHTETQLISMGPSHPATHGTVKIMLEIDGVPRPAEIEVGRNNVRPNEHPVVVRIR